MNLLIVSATSFEIAPTLKYLETAVKSGNYRCHVLTTGVGSVATTYHLSNSFAMERPSLVIQAGICGAFHETLPIGTVVCVRDEFFGDVGVEQNGEFHDLFDLNFIRENDFPYTGKALTNPLAESFRHGCSLAAGVTINEVTTNAKRINELKSKFNADVESMEGAALHYVCLQQKIPFLQLRAISNYVGERNKDKWNIPLAIERLNEKLQDLIIHL